MVAGAGAEGVCMHEGRRKSAREAGIENIGEVEERQDGDRKGNKITMVLRSARGAC